MIFRRLVNHVGNKVANRGAVAIADEIAATYPFHPRLNVIALVPETSIGSTCGLRFMLDAKAQIHENHCRYRCSSLSSS